MANFCTYHPIQPSKWRCAACHRQFCKQCMPDAIENTQKGRCPSCGHSLTFLGMATHIQPFWHRLSAFFLYPLSPNALTILLLCTVLPFFFPNNLLGGLAGLALFCVLLKYTYSIIEYTAEGHLSPPKVGQAFSGGIALLLQQLGIFIVAALFVGLCARFGGEFLATLGVGIALFALPASIILLALSERMGPAINPLQLLSLIGTIGWPYIVLYCHIILMVFALTTLQNLMHEHLSWSLAAVGSGFLFSYFMLIIFHMMGYLLFQYQDRLGFAANEHSADDDRTELTSHVGLRHEADIDMALKEGRYEVVLTLLKADLKRQPEHPVRRQQLFQLLWELQDNAQLREYSATFLRLFASQNQGFRIHQLVEQQLKHDADFKIEDPQLLFKVCEILYLQGKYRMIFALCKDLHKRLSGDPILAEIYVLVAKSLANGMQKWDKALQYLGFVQQNFAQHPVNQQVPLYIEQARQHHRLEAGYHASGL